MRLLRDISLLRPLKAAALGAAVVIFTGGAAMAAVAGTSVNVRSGPGTSYGVVDVLHAGEAVSIAKRSGGWCEIEHTGPDGWVACRYLAGFDSRFNRLWIPDVRIHLGVRPVRPIWWNLRQWWW